MSDAAVKMICESFLTLVVMALVAFWMWLVFRGD